MNNEERIKILKSYSKITQGLKNKDNTKRYNEKLDLRIQAYELLAKFLSIPARTIENLQVGDYVEFVYGKCTVVKGFIKEVGIKEKCEYIIVDNELCDKQYIVLTSKPIPHEFFEVWGERE